MLADLVEAVAGDVAEAFVGFHQQAVPQAGDQQAVGRGMEGLGEFLLGYLQLLLGALQLADVAHHDHQRRGVVEYEGAGRNEPGEEAAVGPAKGHLQVAHAVFLQAQQQARADPRRAPQVEFGGGLADGLLDADTGLFGERGVDLEQHAVDAAGDDQGVRALLEDRGELLFGEAQRMLGLLGFADVDHQSAHHLAVVALQQGDDVPHPDGSSVGGDQAVLQGVILAGGTLLEAAAQGALMIVGVQVALPETGFQPFVQRIAEQRLRVGRDVGVVQPARLGLPGDGREAFDHVAKVLLAAVQFLLQRLAVAHLLLQAMVDAQDDGDDGQQREQGGQAIEQGLMPECAAVEHAADPGLLQRLDFVGAEFGEQLVENADQHALTTWRGHGQLVAVGRFAADVQAVQLELAQAPDAGCEVADHGVGLIGGQRLQGRGYAG